MQKDKLIPKHTGGISSLDKMTNEEVCVKINDYFEMCEEKNVIPLLTELAAQLGTTRKTVREYERNNHKTHRHKDWYQQRRKIFMQARNTCEAALARQLTKSHGQVSGIIFILKNNYGWQDRFEVDNPSGGNIINLTFKSKGNGKDTGEKRFETD